MDAKCIDPLSVTSCVLYIGYGDLVYIDFNCILMQCINKAVFLTYIVVWAHVKSPFTSPPMGGLEALYSESFCHSATLEQQSVEVMDKALA